VKLLAGAVYHGLQMMYNMVTVLIFWCMWLYPCFALNGISNKGVQSYQSSKASVWIGTSGPVQTSDKYIRIMRRLRDEYPRADLVDLEVQTCSVLENRWFEFQDDVCLNEKYTILDMIREFNVEQAYWAAQGVQNPWWAVNTHEDKGTELPLQEQLKFYMQGVEVVKDMFPKAMAFGLLKKDWIANASALDLGCGLGRMSNALAKMGFRKITCVDQAQSFLDEAKKTLTKLAGQGMVVADVAKRVKFVQSRPDLLCVQPPSSIDFVHSVITLQHMKPMLQVAYIEQLCDVLRSGGAGYFQIPTFLLKTSKETRCSLLAENRSFMMMHYTPEDEVRRHLSGRGCKVLSATEYNMIGKAGTSMLFIFEKL